MSLSDKSSYIKETDNDTRFTKTNRRSPVHAWVASIIAVFFLALSVVPIFETFTNNNESGQTYVADAGGIGILCNGLGAGMEKQSNWKNGFKFYPYADKSYRQFTIQEAYGNGLGFVTYYGEGESEDFLVANKDEAPPESSVADITRLESVRNTGDCSSVILTFFANLGVGVADGISTLSQYVVAKAFDSNLICAKTDNTNPADNDGCMNLLKIIGGSSSNTAESIASGTAQDPGIIGALTQSIYYPLIIMAVAVTGIWVLHKGIVQRKLREALSGAIWVVLSVILGLAMLLNPALLSRAPMTVSNTIAGCIIGAFSGENCFTQSQNDGLEVGTGSTDICTSDVYGASFTEKMSLTTNSITCTIWKAFILNPVAEGSFGTNFDALYTDREPLRSIIQNEGLDPMDYCVGLNSDLSANQMFGKTLTVRGEGEGKQVCNLMAYQMHLKVNSKSGTSVVNKDTTYDERWYKVIDVVASDDGMWQHWSPSGTSAANKLAIATLTVVVSALGSVILVVTAAFALVYLISGILLMAFAPVFLLIGVHPGRGKAIMLGWLEKVISNVLKYIVSAAFLIITISLYGGILSNVNNMAMTLLFVIIVTMALFMYRSELMEMFGRVNMGGEKMSSALSDKLKSKTSSVAKKTGALTKAGVSGAVGATIAGGQGLQFGLSAETWKENASAIRENMKVAKSGALDSTTRELKRGTGFVAQTTRAVDRQNVANRQDIKETTRTAADQARHDEASATEANREYLDAVDNEQEFEVKRKKNDLELSNLSGKAQQLAGVEDKVMQEMIEQRKYDALTDKVKFNKTKDPADKQQMLANEHGFQDFEELKKLELGIRDTEINIKVAYALGDIERGDALSENNDRNKVQHRDLLRGVDQEIYTKFSDNYDNRLADEKTLAGLDSYDEQAIDRYTELLVEESTEVYDADILRQKRESAELASSVAGVKSARSRAESDKYDEIQKEIRVGTTVTSRTVERADKKATKAGNKGSEDYIRNNPTSLPSGSSDGDDLGGFGSYDDNGGFAGFGNPDNTGGGSGTGGSGTGFGGSSNSGNTGGNTGGGFGTGEDEDFDPLAYFGRSSKPEVDTPKDDGPSIWSQTPPTKPINTDSGNSESTNNANSGPNKWAQGRQKQQSRRKQTKADNQNPRRGQHKDGPKDSDKKGPTL